MSESSSRAARRAALSKGAIALASLAIAVVASPAAHAQKRKGKAPKEDFYYQEEPGENGKTCETCVNYEPATADKGTCALIEGEVCRKCYCQGWTDKKSGKKAGT